MLTVVRLSGSSSRSPKFLLSKFIYLVVIISLLLSTLAIPESKVVAESTNVAEARSTNSSVYRAPKYTHPQPVVAERPQHDQKSQINNRPIFFVQNEGQADKNVHFQILGENATLNFVDDGLWLTVVDPEPLSSAAGQSAKMAEAGTFSPTPMPGQNNAAPSTNQKIENDGVNIHAVFEGANPKPQIVGFSPYETKISYFRGNDPSNWQPNVSVWGGIRYINLYPGYDLEIAGENGQLVQRLVPNETGTPDSSFLQGLLQRLAGKPQEMSYHFEGVQGVQAVDGQKILNTTIGSITFPLIEEKRSQASAFSAQIKTSTTNPPNRQLDFSTLIA